MAGSSEITDDTSACSYSRFGMKPSLGRRWSILLRPQKAARLQKWQQETSTPRVTRAKEKYETEHKRQDQGQLPRSKGNHQGGSRKGYERPEFDSQGESRKEGGRGSAADRPCERHCRKAQGDRKSTRLNSSHLG